MKLINLLLAVIIACSFVACSDSSDDGVKKALTVILTKNKVKSDNTESTSIKVINENALDVTSECEIFINDVKTENLTFKSDKKGLYKIKAKKGEIESEAVNLVATEFYPRKMLIEDYTGTWCGWCPRVIEALMKYENDSRLVPVAVHDDKEMGFTHVKSMMSRYSVTGFPTAIINRSRVWNGGSLDSELNSQIGVKLAMSTINENGVAKIKVKADFGDYFGTDVRLVVYILEDGLVHTQSNYLSGRAGYENSIYYNKPNKITDFEHNHVLRTATTDVFGDKIPTENLEKFTIYEKDFTKNLTSIKPDKCYIVAFVVAVEKEKDVVLNVEKVKLGESITF